MFDMEPHRVENLKLHTYSFDGPLVDVKIAWKMIGEEINLPVRLLAHTLYEPAWDGGTPLECGHTEPHWSLAMEADLGYPLIVTMEPEFEDNGRLTVVDGRHRLLKLWMLGRETAKVKVVDYDRLLKEAEVSFTAFFGPIG